MMLLLAFSLMVRLVQPELRMSTVGYSHAIVNLWTSVEQRHFQEEGRELAVGIAMTGRSSSDKDNHCRFFAPTAPTAWCKRNEISRRRELNEGTDQAVVPSKTNDGKNPTITPLTAIASVACRLESKSLCRRIDS
jgi:hypothetical protein